MNPHSAAPPSRHPPDLSFPTPPNARHSSSDWHEFFSLAQGDDLLVHDPVTPKEDWGQLLGDYAFGKGLDKLERGTHAPFVETPSPDTPGYPYSPSSLPHSVHPTPQSHHAPLPSPIAASLAEFANTTSLAGFSSIMPPHLHARRAQATTSKSASEVGAEGSAGVTAGFELMSVVTTPEEIRAKKEEEEEPVVVGKGKKPHKSRKTAVAGEPRAVVKKSGAKPEGYTPRPPNAWILYRSEQIRILKGDKKTSGKPQSDICESAVSSAKARRIDADLVGSSQLS